MTGDALLPADGALVTGLVKDRVAAILAGILPNGADPAAPLRERGLDSLGATRLVLELAEEFGVQLPMAWLGDCRGVTELASRVATELATGPAPARRPVVRADPDARYAPFPLTPLQQAYLLGKHPELSADPVGCHLYREFEVAGLDVDRLRQAWHRVVAWHDALRLVVTEDQQQRVLPEATGWTVSVHDEPAGDAEDTVAQVRFRLSHRRYPPGEWPPFAVEVTRRPGAPSVVHLSLDAMVADGTGLDLILNHWWRWYRDPGWTPPAPGGTVRDCVVALDASARSPARGADLDYWVRRLADLPPGPKWSGWPAAEGGDRQRRPLSGTLPAAQWRALRERAGALGVSPTSLILTVFADSLIRHGAPEPFSLVLTTSQRARLPAATDVVGPFTSTAVLVVDGVRERGFAEAARHLGDLLWRDLEHGAVSGVEALRELRTRTGGAAPPTLPVVFTSLLETGRDTPAEGFAGAVSYAVSQTSGVALDAQVWEHRGELRIRWDVTDALLPPGAADVLFAGFLNALGWEYVQAAAQLEHRPLNELQQAYLVTRVAEGGGPWDGCQVYHGFHVRDLDVPRLEAAWARLVTAYDVLRSTVSAGGELLVLPAAAGHWHVPVTSAANGLAERLVSQAFPLDRWPQFDLRVTRGPGADATVHLTLDLTVCDGRSLHFIMRELFRLYADPTARPHPAVSFSEYAGWQRELRAGTDHRAAVEHWHRRLTPLPPGPALSTSDADGAAGAAPSGPDAGGAAGHRIRHEARVPGWAALRGRASQAGIGPDALLLAAFTGALATELGTPFAVPVVRWTAATQRFRPGEYTALSWVAHDPDGSLWDRARRHQELLDRDAAADAASGLAELRQLVLKQRRTGAYAYPVVYTGLLDLADQPLPAGVTAGPWLTCTPDVSLDSIGMDNGDGDLRLFWDVVAADFPPGAPARMFARYVASVHELAGAPAAPATAMPATEASALGAEERHRILYEWNATAREFAADGPIHLLFEEQTRHRPDAVAVRWRGGTMTYRELNRRANLFAWRLRGLGIGPGEPVAICGHRGPELVVGVYAVLKAGGAYLPIEPDQPERRAAGMLAEARAAAVLTTAGALSWTPGVPVLPLDADPAGAGDDRNPPPVTGPDDTAYIIYTSGSTGKPKGVVVTHRPLHNLFEWCTRTFHFGPGDLGLCVTSLGFDLSVFDILGLLGQGAAVYVADAPQQKDPQLLLDVLLTEPVTFWNSAPTTLAHLAPHFPPAGHPGAGHLRLVFLSGDYPPLSLPPQLAAAFPQARLVSLGGATEATVWSNYFVVDRIEESWRSIPYGRPIDNCRYYILDERGGPCPPGEPGDLHIAGACLSQGYVNQPELTARRFVVDPFSQRPGERMYRTGDRAAYLPDGTITFLGRLDDQVKIRGFRVELGEVEYRLRQHPAVHEVVVVAWPAPAGDRVLVAYVVAAGPAAATLTASALRQYAAQGLPDYMVPNYVAFLAGFPATANGKLDRDALPWPIPGEYVRPPAELSPPAESLPPAPAPAVGPGPERLGEELAEIFARLLPSGAVDPARDLWDQGATSFTMVQVSGALQKRYRQRVPVETLLVEPTVAGIARVLAAKLAPAQPPPVPVPAPVAVPAPASVDVLDPAARDRFKRAGWNLRPMDTAGYPLPGAPVADEYYRWRASRRDFTGEPVSLTDLGHLLGLLRPSQVDGAERFLYPSAGDTYAVQTYLHVPAGGVVGLPPGAYYYQPREHALRPVNERPGIDRSVHFHYNRPVYDRAAFELYLVGQAHGIAPLYGEDSERFLALEAGYLGQLLMTGQAASGVGLCPIGAVVTDRLRDALRLDSGHRFLQAFLGGRTPHPPAANGTRPPYPRTDGHQPPAAAARGTAPAWPDRGADTELAVIGLAGRYPGAADLPELWANLLAGRRSTGTMPAGRAAAIGLTGALSEVAGSFLADVDGTDSMLFRIAPHEASTLDPQLRLLLAVVWRALEDAGYTPEALRELGRVGVYVATMWPDHQVTGADCWRRGEPARWSGISADLPSRISHVFGFQGPSVAVNTSCASSLEALHLAGRALRLGDCAAVVVAGVNLVSHPYHLALLSGLDLLTDGDGAAFDATASGWLPGEGAGAVLLRPAGAARGAGDAVHAVIEGTWSGHAGRAARFGAPDARSLRDSMGQALATAGVTADDVDYVECAAAGAALADAAELEALAELFAGRDRPLLVGTVKPNLGHLEAAAGISQLTKVLLQLRHGRIAPTVPAERRSALAACDPAVLRIADRAQPWPADRPGVAGRALVNALGATGTYAHAVVRAAGPAEAGR